MSSEDDARAALTKALDAIRDVHDKMDAYLDKLADECPSDTKLAVVRWAMKHIVNHANEGGSYRTLIYQRLGFGYEAYAPLCGDGMTISNEFDLHLKDTVIAHLKNNDIEAAKIALGCCDESGCFKPAGSGIPTEDKYRVVCYEHSKNLKMKKTEHDV